MRNTIQAVAVVLLATCGSPARGDTPNLSPWQGEWIAEAGDSLHLGLSLSNCNEKSECDAQAFQVYDQLQSCLQHGRSEALANEKEIIITLKRGTIKLRFDGEHAISSETIDQSNCGISSTGNEIVYKHLSQKSYHDAKFLLTGQCYNHWSKAMDIFCSDDDVLNVLDKIHALRYEQVSTFIITNVIDACAKASDVKGCLLDSIGKIYADSKDRSNKLEQQFAPYTQSSDSAEAGKLVKNLAGVYKYRFQNSDVTGEKFESENVLEFVPISKFAAYINIRLYFYNFHQCRVAGIVEYKKVGGFVYQGKSDTNACLLTVKEQGSAVVLDDPTDYCHLEFCGARGYFNGIQFKSSTKRKIRYMPIILKSMDYQNSVDQYKQHHPNRN